MHHISAWCLQRLGVTIRSPETGVNNGCEPSCGCWELNPGPRQEQFIFLAAELSLKSPIEMNLKKCLRCTLCARSVMLVLIFAHWNRAEG